MHLATLPVPVKRMNQTSLLPQSQRCLVDLKRLHLQSGLDPDDLQYLDAAPIVSRSKGLTFRGVSIEP